MIIQFSISFLVYSHRLATSIICLYLLGIAIQPNYQMIGVPWMARQHEIIGQKKNCT